jgi:virulence-associated protein VapD
MPIIVIDPEIVAFNGDDLLKDKLSLGHFLVNQQGLIFLKPPETEEKSWSNNIRSFSPSTSTFEERFPEDPPEELFPEDEDREKCLAEYKEFRSKSLEFEIELEKLKQEARESFAKIFDDTQKEMQEFGRKNITVYFLEQLNDYIFQVIPDQKPETEIEQEKAGGLMIQYMELVDQLFQFDSFPVGDIYFDSPYYGDNLDQDQYDALFLANASPEAKEEHKKYLELKNRGYYDNKMAYGLLILNPQSSLDTDLSLG